MDDIGSPIANAIGLMASNVAVITVRAGESTLHGCTANAWAEAPSPPLILTTLRKGGRTRRLAEEAGGFAVNLLAADQTAIARRFSAPGDRFAGLTTVAGPLGHPLLPGVLAAVECRLHRIVDFGAYDALIGMAEHAVYDVDLRPLTFFAGGFGTHVAT